MLGQRVSAIASDHVMVDEKRIDTFTAIWAAGVQASPAGNWLGARIDSAGRLEVGADLRVPGHDTIYAIGDTARFTDETGRTLPGIAPVAKQQGKHVALAICSGVDRPFRYRDYGKLATIGRHRAVIDFGRMRLSGPLAWLVWCVAHIFFLAGYRNRFTVGMNWLWHYLTFDRGARLITGDGALPAKGESR
jgi:NADH dehydrogenase